MSEQPNKLWQPSPTNHAALQRARELRTSATPAEELLWQLLRARPGGFKFRRQHPIGKYIVDFFCAEVRLAIELDGSVHDPAERQEADRWRGLVIATNQVSFLRFKNEEVYDDIEGVVMKIVSRCEELRG